MQILWARTGSKKEKVKKMSETENSTQKTIKLAIRMKIFLFSMLITPIAIILAIFSGGAGHGNYLFCKIFFPYTMLSTPFYGYISLPFIILAILQIPIYGALLTLSSKKHILIFVGIIILVFHLSAVFLCFLIPVPYFS